MSYPFFGSVSGCRPPITSHCRQEHFHRFKKSSRKDYNSKKIKIIRQKKHEAGHEGFIILQKQL